MSSFIARNLTEIEAVAGCTFACISNTVFRMFSCLQINCQPFYLRQLLKFHPFDWMIEIYLRTEGQGTHHKMVTLQPMPGFSPLLYAREISRFVMAALYLFEKKFRLNEVIPHCKRSVNCCLCLQHAYEYSVMNKSINKVLADL